MGFFGRYLLNVKQVVGSVSMYLEESRSEIKLDCELINAFRIFSIYRYLASEETEMDIGIPNQKALSCMMAE